MSRNKLTEENKNEIRKLINEGYSKSALAAKYGVSRQTIHRIVSPEYYARNLAQAKQYQKENGKKIQQQRARTRRNYLISFHNENDADIIDHLDKQENVNMYIRDLIVEDIKK